LGGVAVGPRRAGATRAAAGSVAQRDHHAAAGAPQFRLQASQELLSRLRRAAVARLLSRPAVLRALLGTRTGLYYIDSTALAIIIVLAGTRCLPIWPSAARPRWAGSSASSCTSSST